MNSSRQFDVRFEKNYCTDLLGPNFVLNAFSLIFFFVQRALWNKANVLSYRHIVLPFLFWKLIQLKIQKSA